jgi:hypothetical protein
MIARDLVVGAIGFGSLLLLWVAVRSPFTRRALGVPRWVVRTFLVFAAIGLSAVALSLEPSGWVALVIGVAVSLMIVGFQELAGARQEAQSNRPCLSDDVADRVYAKALSAAGAAETLRRNRGRGVVASLVLCALGIALPGLMSWTLREVTPASEASAVSPWLSWLSAIALLGLALISAAIHLLGPWLLGFVEDWHLSHLTDAEREAAHQRAARGSGGAQR